MPYFLEYVTTHTVGRAAVAGGTLHEALAYAQKALRGLPCISAVLRHASADSRLYGEGPALAGFTAEQGWRLHRHRVPLVVPPHEVPAE